MDVGTKLRKLRIEHDFTQEYVANELEISQPTYNKLENNVGKLTIEKVETICSLYKIDPLFFFPNRIHVNLGNGSHSNSGIVSNTTSTENLQLITKLYEELLAVKEQQILMLKEEIERLKFK